jgi:Fur family transcriptional regulator, ferric uptake regulator
MHFTGKTEQVWNVLSEQDSFISAMEIYRTLCARGERIGLITVYRALHLIVDAERADVLMGPDGQHRYRRCSPVEHHHLVCRQCLHAVEIYDTPSGQLSGERLRNLGFADDSLRIKLVGLCQDCSPG